MNKRDRDAIGQLNRFLVGHGTCAGAFQFRDPASTDLVEGADPTKLQAWIEICCSGCGASTRELVLLGPWLRDFFQLAAEAGVDRDELTEAIRSEDEGALDRLGDQVKNSPAMLRRALRDIRQGQADESQN